MVDLISRSTIGGPGRRRSIAQPAARDLAAARPWRHPTRPGSRRDGAAITAFGRDDPFAVRRPLRANERNTSSPTRHPPRSSETRRWPRNHRIVSTPRIRPACRCARSLLARATSMTLHRSNAPAPRPCRRADQHAQRADHGEDSRQVALVDQVNATPAWLVATMSSCSIGKGPATRSGFQGEDLVRGAL